MYITMNNDKDCIPGRSQPDRGRSKGCCRCSRSLTDRQLDEQRRGE